MDLEHILGEKMKLDRNSLSGKVAVVTGGAKGIGKQTAIGLALLGARVAVIDKDQNTLAQTARKVTAAGTAECVPVVADISREGALYEAVRKVQDEWEEIDILVNNAAESFIGSYQEESQEVWDRIFNVNLRYPAQVIKSLLPGMVNNGYGVVANVISLEGLTFSTAYSAAKVGMRSLTTSIATEIGNDSRVSIFSFAPGIVDTPLVNTYFYPELAKRFGMTMQDIVDGIGGNPGYSGLMPAEDCGAALVHCIVNAEAYDGEVASPFLPLAKAGVITFEDVDEYGSEENLPAPEEELGTVNTSLREYLKSVTEINRNLEHRISVRTRELRQANEELQSALSEVRQLSGMLPICSECKNVRDDQGYWNKIEKYISAHTDADFSHSLCPHCAEKLYGEEPWFIAGKHKKSSK